MPSSFAILGSGAWGIAVALHLDALGHRVVLFCHRSATANELLKNRQRALLLPGITIPERVLISDQTTVAADCEHWISAIPTKYLREAITRFEGIAPSHGIVSLSKGLEINTFARPSEILAMAAPPRPVAVLSGPSHAEEVVNAQPTSVLVASANNEYAETIQAAFGSERFRVYTSTDAVGVELAGAVKNVLAIAAGVGDGLGFGDNAKAALLSRGIVEMTRFGVAHGGRAETFAGLAGLGDLMATCFSRHGRNRRAGELIARGIGIDEILRGPHIVEGYYTAKSVHERSLLLGLDLPIVRSVYELLYECKSPAQAVQDLMARPQKPEDRP